MNLIYIAGPYREYKDSEGKVHSRDENVENAEKWMIKLLKDGWSVICPHKNTHGTEKYTGWEDAALFLMADYEQIRRCDAIIMLKGFTYSNGAKSELGFALSIKDIRVYYEGGREPLSFNLNSAPLRTSEAKHVPYQKPKHEDLLKSRDPSESTSDGTSGLSDVDASLVLRIGNHRWLVVLKALGVEPGQALSPERAWSLQQIRRALQEFECYRPLLPKGSPAYPTTDDELPQKP